MKRTDQFTISGAEPKLIQLLDRKAREERRSRSSMAIILLMEKLFPRSDKPAKGGGGNRTRSLELATAA